ncbi:MAG: DegT/DnrJ/EryC1/StrS family aminotransferase [Ilumatobacteraceae bacterium]
MARGGHLLLGERTAAFEERFAAWTGARHACAVSSGASALQLALAAVGVGPGDEVIVPSFTAVPSASAVCALGATPVLADVDDDTACLAPSEVERLRTPRTRAVMVVHLYGYPAPLPLTDLPIVEDAAQAHGALRDPGRSAVTAYSFYPTKVLGGIGDGGAVVTDDPAIDAAVRTRRVHGMSDVQYWHTTVSQNFRMSELEAAWLLLGLDELDADVARRRAIAARIREIAPGHRWQSAHPDHAHHLLVLRSGGRDTLRAGLAERGIGTAVHYPLAVHQQPAYAHLSTESLPVSTAWAAECVSVPCFPEMTDAEVELVGGMLAEVAAIAAGATT